MHNSSSNHDRHQANHSHDQNGKQYDPVCGMAVKPDSPHHETFEGKTYRFCSARCQEKFQAAPQRFAS
ncbi:MAG TPA: hypothetical protein DCS07_00310, partial [Bdellovibrionales bacterium]|nr:hypothetical protein [Bdellovibrionales bacterium]HCH75287.1 hypothetical protein [Pseudomonas sp.]